MIDRLQWLFWPVVIIVIQQAFFPAPAGAVMAGIVLGLVTALVSLGMYLVYRANRVINFAAAELGLLPAVVCTLLIVETGLTYWLTLPLGLIGAALLGVLVEFVIIRRFFESPRLVVTVATIGVAQLLGVIAIFIPAWWDSRLQSQRIPAPFDTTWEVGSRTLNVNHLIAAIIAPLAILAVGAILRWTRLGIAIRAASELPARAGLLGIPVKGLQSIVWGLATMLGFLALFLRAGIYGLPVGGALGLLFFLRALAALTLGRLAHLPTILATSIALGVLQEGIVRNSDAIQAKAQMGAITGGVIIVALLLRRNRGARADTDGSSWQAAGDPRPMPAAFRSLPIVSISRTVGILLAIGAVGWLIPYSGVFGTQVINRFSEIFLFTLVLLSLGVLTGWAGQISLGQLAFSAIGSVTAAKLTLDYNVDITIAVLFAAAVGGVASLVVGLPALRLKGAYLAVTTLAFAIMVHQYLLNPQFFDFAIRPEQRIERLPIFGIIEWDTTRGSYYVSLITMVLGMAAIRGIRNSRTGRILIALRDNEDGTEAYGVSAVRAKLTAFAISGSLAAASGAVLVHYQRFFLETNPGFNIPVFTASVIGGLGTIAGAFIGSLYFNGTFFWLDGNWRLLASGIGVLGVLWLAPSGLLGLWHDLRDLVLRWIGARRGITDVDRADDLVDDLTGPRGAVSSPGVDDLPDDATAAVQ